MPQSIRFSVREGEQTRREISRELRQLPFRKITYINPLVARAKLAAALQDRVKELWDSLKINQKYNVITSTRWGKSYINSTIIDQVKRYVNDPATISMIRRELKQIYKNDKIQGEQLLREVEKMLAKYIQDKDALRKVIRATESRILFSEVGKKGVIDTVSKKVVYIDENGKFVFAKNVNEFEPHAKAAGIKVTPEDYVEQKLVQITVEAIEKGKDVEDAKRIFFEKYQELLEKDKLFKVGMEKKMEEEVLKYYNYATLYKLAEDLMIYLPSFMISMTAKLLAKAVNAIPLLGGIASIQYEVAATIAEVGNHLKDRIESSASMWYNLDPSIAPIVKESVEKQLQEQTAKATV
ncbi:hypothetical protein Igag_1964 [Ignisphaera aggregans DSM 17230]|uniref:Uncharacterized protein n=1 Tax=Ignisphaera aggregans (strain DSM 17230 / JCM 13409 / AQ1.S1) TaxID=583356 RepID=E0STH0_IGNAA|nr:hypothetical protein Igag_1964 [Ignisphaera aggregans DSM 17230]